MSENPKTENDVRWEPLSDVEEKFALYSAVANPRDNEPVDIVDVIAELTQRETLGEGETIRYIGRGNFAVVYCAPQSEGPIELKRIIEYENRQETIKWRLKLRIKSHLQYEPDPKPLQSLYSSEQIRAMPKFT